MSRISTHYCDSCGAEIGRKAPERHKHFKVPSNGPDLYFSLEINRDLCPVCMDEKVTIFISMLREDLVLIARKVAEEMTERVVF